MIFPFCPYFQEGERENYFREAAQRRLGRGWWRVTGRVEAKPNEWERRGILRVSPADNRVLPDLSVSETGGIPK